MVNWEFVRDNIIKYINLRVGDSIENISYPTPEKTVFKIWNRKEFEKVLSLLNNLTNEFNGDLLNLYTREKIKCEFKLNSVTYELIIEFSER